MCNTLSAQRYNDVHTTQITPNRDWSLIAALSTLRLVRQGGEATSEICSVDEFIPTVRNYGYMGVSYGPFNPCSYGQHAIADYIKKTLSLPATYQLCIVGGYSGVQQ